MAITMIEIKMELLWAVSFTKHLVMVLLDSRRLIITECLVLFASRQKRCRTSCNLEMPTALLAFTENTLVFCLPHTIVTTNMTGFVSMKIPSLWATVIPPMGCGTQQR
jgi:hypothetical protein